MMVQEKIGRIFITILTSSTCCTEHCNALQAGVSETARLRKLRLVDGVSIDPTSFLFEFSLHSLPVGIGGEGLEVILAMALVEFLDAPQFSKAAIRT